MSLIAGAGFGAGRTTLFDFGGATPYSLDLSDFAFGSTPAGFSFQLSFVGDTLVLDTVPLVMSPVPEPATYAAAGVLALGGMLLARRRRPPNHA